MKKSLFPGITKKVFSQKILFPRGEENAPVDTLRQVSEAGFAAIVTKDHDYSGVMTAALIVALNVKLVFDFVASQIG